MFKQVRAAPYHVKERARVTQEGDVERYGGIKIQ